MACSRDESGIKEGEREREREGRVFYVLYISKRSVEREFIRRSNFGNFLEMA